MASMTTDVWEKSFEDENVIYVPEIDDTILMKLLDESAAEEAAADEVDDDDRLESVIRSLEDEIGPAAAACGMVPEAIHPYVEDCEDCGLDDILLDLDGHDCSRSVYDWMEMEVRSPGTDAGDWYVDECMHGASGVWCGDARCHSSFYYYPCGDASVEQMVYGSLWE